MRPLAADSDTANVRSVCPLSPSATVGLSMPTVGASSSSSSVSGAPVTDSDPPAAWLFAAVPPTVPPRFASSCALSTAVMVTVSASVVAPAAITISASASTVYRPLTAAMVTVVVALDVVPPLSVAVTSAVPPFSEIESSSSDSVTVGASSSSVIVPVPTAVPMLALVAPLSVSFTVSFGSSCVSPVTDTVIVLLVSFAANVSVPAASAA